MRTSISSGSSSTPGVSDFSPGCATRRPGILSRLAASASAIAPWRTFFHSSSVLGTVSTSPFSSTIVVTDSHTTSAEGSTMDNIKSLMVAVGRYVGSGGAGGAAGAWLWHARSEEHTSELQSQSNLVCRLLLE